MVGIAAVAAAFAVALAWCWASLRLGPALGFVDRPDGLLKTHRAPAVPLGGVGIFLGVMAALALDGTLDPWLIGAMTAVLALGIADDRFDLDPRLRLLVEIAIAVIVALFAVPGSLGIWDRALVALVVVAAVNAVNLFDGLDGLAGSAALVSGVAIAILGSLRGVMEPTPLFLAAACAGVLVFNWHPARVFLGDNGAYLVGLLVALGIAWASPGGGAELVTATFLLGVFAFDLVVTVVRRRLADAPLISGDRTHLYDQLHARGMTVPRVALAAAAGQAVWAAAVIATDQLLGGWWGVAALLGLSVVVVASLASAGFLRPQPG